jgi:Na+-transporting methylmalonyl-CoA/oxaloacetate decarboxylase gamma subunit
MTTDPLLFGLEITLVGMGVVYLGLLLVTAAIALMRRLDERWQAGERREDEAALGATPTIDSTTLVLIAAAVATLIGGRHRIRGVRRLLPGESSPSAWAITGRAVLQGSHVITSRSSGRQR